jgi:hypothetical protein
MRKETHYLNVQAPKILSTTNYFFCTIGNLTAIYDVRFFWENSISPIRKDKDWMLWLTILQQIKTAKPVPEA